jgi:hypothetical protein
MIFESGSERLPELCHHQERERQARRAVTKVVALQQYSEEIIEGRSLLSVLQNPFSGNQNGIGCSTNTNRSANLAQFGKYLFCQHSFDIGKFKVNLRQLSDQQEWRASHKRGERGISSFRSIALLALVALAAGETERPDWW